MSGHFRPILRGQSGSDSRRCQHHSRGLWGPFSCRRAGGQLCTCRGGERLHPVGSERDGRVTAHGGWMSALGSSPHLRINRLFWVCTAVTGTMLNPAELCIVVVPRSSWLSVLTALCCELSETRRKSWTFSFFQFRIAVSQLVLLCPSRKAS